MPTDEYGVEIEIGQDVIAMRAGLLYEGKVTRINPVKGEVKVVGDGFEMWFSGDEVVVQMGPDAEV